MTQRFNNELWEIDPATRKVKTKIAIGREPVAMAPFAGDSCLLIANNLPEMPSTAYPIAVQLDIVDIPSKKVTGRIMLPNGATDAKSVAVDKNQTYAYVTHSDCPLSVAYQSAGPWMDGYKHAVHHRPEGEEIADFRIVGYSSEGSRQSVVGDCHPDDKQIIVAAAGSQELIRIDRIALHERLAKAKQGRW